MMLDMPKSLIALARDIESTPEGFDFLEKDIRIDKSYSNQYPVMCKVYSTWPSSQQATFISEQLLTYQGAGLEELATYNREKALKRLTDARLRESVEISFNDQLKKKCNFDKYFNAWFVSTQFWPPIREALEKIKSKALEKSEVSKHEQNLSYWKQPSLSY